MKNEEFAILHSNLELRTSALPERDLVYLPSLRPVLRLVVRPRGVVGAWNTCLGAKEFGDERRGDLEVLAVVGDVEAAAAGDERPSDLRERLGADDAALVLALPRPRIGKIDVDLA